jgi:hypothetical protein
MIGGSGSGSGSIPLTIGSGWTQAAHKHVHPDQDSDPDPQHWKIQGTGTVKHFILTVPLPVLLIMKLRNISISFILRDKYIP